MAASSRKKNYVITEIVDKIAFANYLPLLTRATADNREGTPGYMIAEIEISYDFPHHCKQLAAYLSRRLEKPSAPVKLKVLKIMDHLIREAHVNVRVAFRKNDSSIKMTTMYHGVPDPLTGSALYENVRANAKELLELLFMPEKIQEDEKLILEAAERPPKPFLGALGSSNTSEGKYQGFGNSPRMKEETVADKVLSYFDRLSTTSDQNAKIIREGIASSVGNYEAVLLPDQHYQAPYARAMPSMPPPPRPSSVKAHVPGRAGGGWEDSEEEGEEPPTSLHPSLVSADSLETIEALPENSAEKELITKFCSGEKFPISWKELSEVCAGCIQLSGWEALRAVTEVLQTGEGPPVLRALTLLDALLHTELLASPRAVTEAYQLLGSPLTAVSKSANKVHKDRARKIQAVLACRMTETKS